MLCDQAMSTFVQTCRETTTIGECARHMRDLRVGYLVIVDGDNHPLGVVTDRDITIRAMANEFSPRMAVGEIMTRPPLLTCHREDPLELLEHRMGELGKSRALVIDLMGRLEGVITIHDVAAHEPLPERTGALVAQVAHHPVSRH